MVSGSHQDLIVLAGKQLQALFECYREGMEQWVRIRPGFTRSLVADTLLACLLRILKDQPPENVRHEAQLWLKACHLPLSHLDTLSSGLETRQITQIRTSCCLVYKCKGRKLCENCPRHEQHRIARQKARPCH